jgi:hypothetical protein
VTEEGDLARLQMRDIIDELREIKETLAQLERLIEQIALGMGVRPHG